MIINTREQALAFLQDQLDFLKKENVANLMKRNRIDKLEEISDKLEIEPLEEIIEHQFYLKLRNFEIPREYLYELAFLISQTKLFDEEFFECYEEFMILLQQNHPKEKLAKTIAKIMQEFDLCDCTIEELLKGK